MFKQLIIDERSSLMITRHSYLYELKQKAIDRRKRKTYAFIPLVL